MANKGKFGSISKGIKKAEYDKYGNSNLQVGTLLMAAATFGLSLVKSSNPVIKVATNVAAAGTVALGALDIGIRTKHFALDEIQEDPDIEYEKYAKEREEKKAKKLADLDDLKKSKKEVEKAKIDQEKVNEKIVANNELIDRISSNISEEFATEVPEEIPEAALELIEKGHAKADEAIKEIEKCAEEAKVHNMDLKENVTPITKEFVKAPDKIRLSKVPKTLEEAKKNSYIGTVTDKDGNILPEEETANFKRKKNRSDIKGEAKKKAREAARLAAENGEAPLEEPKKTEKVVVINNKKKTAPKKNNSRGKSTSKKTSSNKTK